MGTLPQVLKTIFEVQRKMSNEKTTRREINFPTYKTFFFLWTLPFFKPHNFFNFLFVLNDLKCYRSANGNSTNYL
jgi:hypothetical protein